MEDVPILLEYEGKEMNGFAVPLDMATPGMPLSYDIIIDKAFMGTLRKTKWGWMMDPEQEPELIHHISRCIIEWYDLKARPQPAPIEDHHAAAS